MEVKIDDSKENLLLSRKELKATVAYQGPVPKKEDIKKAIAANLKCDEKLLVIKLVSPAFKGTAADISAYQYISAEDMAKIEPKPRQKKKTEEAKE